ncbi:hypothetical protein [Nocardioides nitrophenolicus]|uniref:hypothetical protein n=1 Tax=Nocardioides nitrophenolicus TaxID=60489 RepID=UPI00195A16C7|nr:hypothetical protein [Nocardioides nitrophenolicus]
MLIILGAAAVGAAVAIYVAISSNEDLPASTKVSANLMVRSDSGDGDYLGAALSGILQINKQGCVTLGDYPLVAPAGSRVAADSSGVEFPGVGLVTFGEPVRGSGGYVEAAKVGEILESRDCLSSAFEGHVVIIHEVATP